MPRPLGWTPTTPVDDVNLNANTKDVIGDLDSLNKIHFPNSDLVSAINAVPGMMSKIFYVDSINGDDLNDGSQANPFKTIKKAIDSVPVGGYGTIYIVANADVVIQETGIETYNKYLRFLKQGTANVTIQKVSNTSFDFRFYNCLVYFSDINFQGKPKDPNITYDYNWVANISLKNSLLSLYNSSIAIDNGSFVTGVDSLGYAGLFLYNCSITTTADTIAVFKLFSDIGAYIFKNGSTIDDASKHISDIIRDTNGTPRNIVSNLVL